MGPSEKTFNQVKSILGKLDRSIDQLRAQRTHTPPAGPAGDSPRSPTPEPPPAAPARPSSMYGRATPLKSA